MRPGNLHLMNSYRSQPKKQQIMNNVNNKTALDKIHGRGAGLVHMALLQVFCSCLVWVRVVHRGWRRRQGFSYGRKLLGAVLYGVVAGEPAGLWFPLEEVGRFVIAPVFHSRPAPALGIAQHHRALLSWRVGNLQCWKILLLFVADQASPAAGRKTVPFPRLLFGMFRHSHSEN